MKKSFLTLLATAIAIQISFCNTIEGRTIYQGNDPAEYIEAGTVFKWYSDNVKFEILKGPGEIVQIDGVDHISLPTVGDVLVRTSCLWDDGNTYYTSKVITKISRPKKGRHSFCPTNRGRAAVWGRAASRSCQTGHYARSVGASCIRLFR